MTMVFAIILLILAAAVVILLFTPLVLQIDTRVDLYQVRWGPARAALTLETDELRYRLHVPFWTKEGMLGDLFGPRHERSVEPRRDARMGTERGSQAWRPSVRALLRSFRVRRFHWSLDTDDPLWNAWLFPAFHMMHVRGRDVSISFTGRNELALTIHNNLYRLLMAVLLEQHRTIKTQVQ